MLTPLAAALDRHRRSALTARRAAREAVKARRRGVPAVALAVAAHQMAQARMGEDSVAAMLSEQGITARPDAPLNLAAFTTSAQMIHDMLVDIPTNSDSQFERLVESLVQDAGRAAESVAVAARPDVGWVRHLTPPSCSRCVVLAGRVYRYNDGFKRHPGDDCVTTPVREGDSQRAADPLELLRQGKVTGLSKADVKALRDGADFNQVVNVRRTAAGLTEAGRVLARAGRPTPEGIYRMASDRDEVVALLGRYGYILT
jgi:hypothetical protein